MIVTRSIPYRGNKTLADELNRESARHYNAVLSNHWRAFRKKGVWLSEKSAYRWEDYQSGGTILHAHSRDAAQQAFYRSCKTARTLKRHGNSEARYPKYRRGFRTTIWKNTGIRKSGSTLLLAELGPGSDHGVDPDRLGVLSSLGSPACVRQEVLQVHLAHGARRWPCSASRAWRPGAGSQHGRDPPGRHSGH